MELYVKTKLNYNKANKNLWPSLHLTDLDKMYSITRYILPFISPTRAHVSVFQSLILPPRHPDITTFSPRNYSFSIFHSFIHLILPPRHPDITTFSPRYYSFSIFHSFIHLILPPRHPDITTFSSRFYTFNPYFIHVFIQSFIHHFIYSFIVFFSSNIQ